ncbi:MAG: TlpA family protein disulfide reductase [Acidimicrobiales bacterium]
MSDSVAPSPSSRFPWRLRVLLAAGIAVTGLAIVGVIETVHYSSAANRQASTEGASVGFFRPKSTKAVPFLLPLLAGGRRRAGAAPVSQASLLGEPVVVNMWASTCTVCRTETPAIEAVSRRLGPRVRFVGIDTADLRGAGLAFVHRYGVTYPQLFDPKAVVATGYGIPGLPVTVFVSARGQVVGENIGALTVATLNRYLGVLFGV